MDHKETYSAMLKKLNDSGLALALDTLAYTAYSSDEAYSLPLVVQKAGFKIPYFDIYGKITEVWNYRILEKDKTTLKNVLGRKDIKYVKPAGSRNELYFPPLVNWGKIAADTHKDIYITEGELKAACASLNGWATIGLSGVWGFRCARSMEVPLLATFGKIQWKDRNVYVIFDSDAGHNPNIADAENVLCKELTILGAIVHIIRLANIEGLLKTGFDDLIVRKGVAETRLILEESSSLYASVESLHQLNSEVLYVKDPGIVMELHTRQKMHPRAFVDHAYANRRWIEYIHGKKGSVKAVERAAASEWLKWAHRTEVSSFVYEPGLGEFVDGNNYNLWEGWGVAPTPGSIEPWSNLLKFIFKAEEEAMKWFEMWAAYPLQFPGTKLFTTVVVWGVAHGTGKSLIGETLMRIYGKNSTEIGNRELHGIFNDWISNKQFVVGDEIVGGDKRHMSDRLKSMITQKEVRINAKFLPSYVTRDTVNYYFTSQHSDAFFIEDTDRRYFIHEVLGKPAEHSFYLEYITWLNGKGAAHLFHHLLNIDISTFKPTAPAIMTASKSSMVERGRSELSTWVHILSETPSDVLRIGTVELDYDLWTSEELRAIYDPSHRTKVTSNGMGRALKNEGFRQATDNPLRTKVGHKRLWVIKNAEAYRASVSSEIAMRYESERNL